MAYGKLFESMFTGSMVGTGPVVFAVWTYVIAHAKPPGTVELNPKIMAAILGCDVEDVRRAVETLCAPDPESRSPEEGGRRLIPEGPFLYRVTTWAKYHAIRNEVERREQNRESQRRHRIPGDADGQQPSAAVSTCQQPSAAVSTCQQPSAAVSTCQQPSAVSAHADADADADTPSIHPSTVPVRTIPTAPVSPDGMDGWDGGAPHKSPDPDPTPHAEAPGASTADARLTASDPLQDLSRAQRSLLAALDLAGYCDRLGLTERAARAASLDGDGLTPDLLAELVAEAGRKGRQPAALLARWIDTGGWRGVLADLALARKERRLRAHAPTPAEIGPVFGEQGAAPEPRPIATVLPNPRDGMDPWVPSPVHDQGAQA